MRELETEYELNFNVVGLTIQNVTCKEIYKNKRAYDEMKIKFTNGKELIISSIDSEDFCSNLDLEFIED